MPELFLPLAELLPASAPPGAETEAIETLVALIVVATMVGLAARRLRVPYTVALVFVGIGLHSLGWIPAIHLTPGLLMSVFLPALLFEAAIHVPADQFRRMLSTLLILAIPGVLVAAFVTAGVLHAELLAFSVEEPLPFLTLLLFGTMIAATDPISVVALFKQLGVEKRLAVLIEGESLLNDGTAVVLFGLMLDVVLKGTGDFSVPTALVKFAVVACGGLIIGAAIGLLASWATSLFDDHLIEIALTTITAYGAFLIAERAHVSGVLATVTAGILVGNVGKKRGMSPQTRISVLSFWEYMAFFINSIVFLLLGLEVSLPVLFDRIGVVILAFLAALAARAVTVYGPIPLLRRLDGTFDAKRATVLWWGGLRGSLSMVLVLSLPKELPGREILIAATFGVVVLSVILQGGSMGFVMKKLGLVPKRTQAMRYLARKLARLKAIDAERAAIAKLLHEGVRDLPGLSELDHQLDLEHETLVKELSLKTSDPDFVAAATARASAIREHLREIARDSYREALDDNLIDAEDAAELVAKIEEQGVVNRPEG